MTTLSVVNTCVLSQSFSYSLSLLFIVNNKTLKKNTENSSVCKTELSAVSIILRSDLQDMVILYNIEFTTLWLICIWKTWILHRWYIPLLINFLADWHSDLHIFPMTDNSAINIGMQIFFLIRISVPDFNYIQQCDCCLTWQFFCIFL